MVVASSNNKAVENVSAKFRDCTAIANDAPELRYFKTLSDAMHQSETWGAIAAVWEAPESQPIQAGLLVGRGQRTKQLPAGCCGFGKRMEITDPETGNVERRTPRIVEAEQPPANREEALERWRSAQKRFLSALERVPVANMVGEPAQ